MNNLNSTLLEGNLVRDPEFKYTGKGVGMCKFSIATNRYYKQGQGDNLQTVQEVSFFDIVTWGKTAETCNEYLTKGRGVRVVGRLKQNRWTDDNGKNHSQIVVIGEHVEFKPKPKSQEQQGGNTSEPPPAADFEDDIPF